jgi:hypothetical protein
LTKPASASRRKVMENTRHKPVRIINLSTENPLAKSMSCSRFVHSDFAEPLFTTITKYFGSNSDETPDEVIDRAYVASDEIGNYKGVLETYLKDRTDKIAGNQLKPIVTSKNTATGISSEIQRFSLAPSSNARVQPIIGSVGAGKSTFIRRFYRRLMTQEVAKKTRWAFLNFNVMPPGLDGLKMWIAEQFAQSFAEINNIGIYEDDQVKKIFGANFAGMNAALPRHCSTASAPSTCAGGQIYWTI